VNVRSKNIILFSNEIKMFRLNKILKVKKFSENIWENYGLVYPFFHFIFCFCYITLAIKFNFWYIHMDLHYFFYFFISSYQIDFPLDRKIYNLAFIFLKNNIKKAYSLKLIICLAKNHFFLFLCCIVVAFKLTLIIILVTVL